jgi:hypothetical protein
MPLIPTVRGGQVGRLVVWCVATGVRASLLISPWPAALLVRSIFAVAAPRCSLAPPPPLPDTAAPANAGSAISAGQRRATADHHAWLRGCGRRHPHHRLRGVILACGPYDLELGRHASWPAGRLFCRSCFRRTRARDASSTTPCSRRGRSQIMPGRRSRLRSSPLARPTRYGLTLSCSPQSSAPGEQKARRSSSPPTTSRHWVMSTSSTSTPTPASCSSTGCSHSCGSGSQRHHSHQARTLVTVPARRHNGSSAQPGRLAFHRLVRSPTMRWASSMVGWCPGSQGPPIARAGAPGQAAARMPTRRPAVRWPREVPVYEPEVGATSE